MLLQRSDFPAGWIEGPDRDEPQPDDGDDLLPDECDLDQLTDFSTGIADTGFFGRPGGLGISQNITVFSDPYGPPQLFDYIEDVWLDCFVQAINLNQRRDVQTNQAVYEAIPFPVVGDATKAFRVFFQAGPRPTISLLSEAESYFDIVLVANGRVAFAILAVSSGTPPDTDQVIEYVQKANARVRQQP